MFIYTINSRKLKVACSVHSLSLNHLPRTAVFWRLGKLSGGTQMPPFRSGIEKSFLILSSVGKYKKMHLRKSNSNCAH